VSMEHFKYERDKRRFCTSTWWSRWWRPDKTVRALNTAAKTSAASANMQLVPGLVNSIQFSLYL
jgi:hypothetical protein